MTSSNEPKRISRRRFLGASATAIAGLALAACGNDSGSGATGGQGGQTRLTWSTWGNPGEIARFREWTTAFNEEHENIQAELIPIPNAEYDAKMLTQLTGGTAPDVFYAGDAFISKLIDNNSIVELTQMLSSPESESKPEDFFSGLWGAAKTTTESIYGVPVDCNPMVLWYNKKLLTDAGVTRMPAELYNEGQWTWDAFTKMCEQVVAKGKRGYILSNWWGHVYSWVTCNGGKVYDVNNFVAHEDPKAVAAYKFMYDNLQNNNFVYAGSLPKGQGEDAMFMSQQVAFVGAGRWLLPVFKKNDALEFDIAPWPTNTGNKIEPAGVPTAYMVINAKTPNKDAAFALLTNFVSKEGQIFRLKGGGNAVPSIEGADEVVMEGNIPAHAQALLDAREVGYALWSIQASVPGLSQEIEKAQDKLWLQGGDVQGTLNQIAQMVNQQLKKAA